MRIKKERTLTIQKWSLVDNNVPNSFWKTCLCGKHADYRVKLTGSSDSCPICKSCLIDRLNKPGQSLEIKEDGSMVQLFAMPKGKIKERTIYSHAKPVVKIIE